MALTEVCSLHLLTFVLPFLVQSYYFFNSSNSMLLMKRLAFSNWMFFELDLEFDEDDFKELLLDLEDFEDFSGNI